MIDPFGFSKYLLIIAHADDEVQCAALLHRLVAKGKQLKIVLLTAGDLGLNSGDRAHEMAEAVRQIGLQPKDIARLEIPEKELLASAPSVYTQVLDIASAFSPDCVLSIDYEGGHEGHDLTCYITHRVAKQLDATHLVFPDYHFESMEVMRHGMDFIPGRAVDFTLNLDNEGKELKVRLLEEHRGQIGTYLRIQKNQDNFFTLLFGREIYRVFPREYDFLARPDYGLGYEYHRNGFKFDDVARAIESIG